jgi:protein TonB
MKIAAIFGIVCAVVFHTGVILFGGILFNSEKENHGTLQQVDLLDAQDAAKEKEKEKPKDKTVEKKDELKAETEKPPDATELARDLDVSPVNDAPALDAASLSSIEAALNGQGAGGGDFAEALSFASGGRIGGMGKPGGAEDGAEGAFSLAEIDQKPRAVYQVPPSYPSELRGKKVEGVVTIIFVVDAEGKVANPRVEKSTDHAFEDPAMTAVRRWKFEPAVRAGQRVACKMRVPIRFEPTGS